MLYDKLREDLKISMKDKNTEYTSALRFILSELSRLNKLANELPTEDEIIAILNVLQKNEKIVLNKLKLDSSVFLEVVENYLPKMMTKEEIKEYLDSIDIDFSKFNNLNQAMGFVMKSLKGLADGKLVKEVLNEIFEKE